MELRDYFETKTGMGVLSTANADGRVDAAIYARPHVMEDGTLAFIMADRLSHRNLESNPHALYLFREDGPGWAGKRLSMTRVAEEKNTERLESLRRRKYSPEDEARMKPLYLVFFELDEERPLVGG